MLPYKYRGTLLLLWINNAFYHILKRKYLFEIGKFYKMEEMNLFELLPCNYWGPLCWFVLTTHFILRAHLKYLSLNCCLAITYWGALFDIFYQHRIFFCVVVEVQTHRWADRAKTHRPNCLCNANNQKSCQFLSCFEWIQLVLSKFLKRSFVLSKIINENQI